MKKIIFFIITVLTVTAVLFACTPKKEAPEKAADSNSTAADTSAEEPPAEEGSGGGVGWMVTECKYMLDFYHVESRFIDLVGMDEYMAWMESLGVDGWPEPEEYSVLAFIRQFNVPKEDFKAADRDWEGYEIFTDNQIDALYSDDPKLLARMFANPDAINVDGEIYTPRWIMDHSLEEIRAVGITDEMLWIKYNEVFYEGEDEENPYNKKLKSMLDMLEVDAKYDFGFYGIERHFIRGIVDEDAYEEWVNQSGYYEGTVSLDEFNVLEFIKYFDISKNRFTVAAVSPPYNLGDGPFFTDEKIDALYSDDKNLLAETFMAPEAINVNGEIYTPRWIANHSIEEIRAAGITEEVLQSKYDEWIDSERLAENSEICTKTKALLEDFK